MNIEGFGEQIIEDFYNMNYLNSFTDFYNLYNYKNELMELEGFGEKSINNLLDEIEKSKKNSLEKFLFSLGIRYVGSKTAKILAKNYKNIDNLVNASYEDLISIKDIGDVIAKSVYDYFSNLSNIDMISEFKNLGLNLNYNGSDEKEDGIFENMIFVLTGTLKNFKRNDLKKIIENNGGNVTGTVSKKTNVVIVGDSPGSKYDDAVKFNIEIWNEEKLLELLK